LELWLVGPQGAAVFDAWENGNRRFVELQGSNWDQKFLFPGLVKRTDDMVIMLTGRRVEIAISNREAVPASVPQAMPVSSLVAKST
jgi:hypothetical protein